MITISICIEVLELWPTICQNKSFKHFPHPRKKHKNEAKNESHHDNLWNLLYRPVLANFYMPGIFSSPNILVQTQLGHYLYHPTFHTCLVFTAVAQTTS